MTLDQVKLTLKDKKIIAELEKNSRAPAAQIAKKIALSTEVVNYRLKNLISRGVIRRNYTVIDFSRLGYTIYRILLQLENISEKDEEKIINHLKNIPNARWVGVGSGAWDILVTIQAKTVAEFNEIIMGILNKFGANIRNKDITISIIQTAEPPGYLLEEEYKYDRYTHLPAKGKKIKLDKIDYKILKLLYKDARIPTTEIAKQVDISSDAVQYRIKRLLKEKIIQRFICWLDRKVLGYQHYKVLLRLQHATSKQQEKLIKYCESHPNIIFYASIVGSWDLELDIDTTDSTQFHQIMRDLRNKFTDLIRNYETIVIIQDFLCDTEF